MIPKTDTCSSCGQLRPMYHVKKKLCGFCWKKSKADTWKTNLKKVTKTVIKRYCQPIKKISERGKLTIKEDTKFYKELWNDNPHYCENCRKYLGEQLNKSYISHILSKGAYPNHRHNKENINILCFKCHQIWEFGKKSEMPIYRKNENIINKLKKI